LEKKQLEKIAPGEIASGEIASGEIASGEIAPGEIAPREIASGRNTPIENNDRKKYLKIMQNKKESERCDKKR
jgi:hypothetical protein